MIFLYCFCAAKLKLNKNNLFSSLSLSEHNETTLCHAQLTAKITAHVGELIETTFLVPVLNTHSFFQCFSIVRSVMKLFQ